MGNKPLISFDYAIKYLLKNKGDHDIIEGFISALFKAEGYGPVKIDALLESESNKEAKELKRSIADLIVEDQEGHKYIVEIEREYDKDFIYKACFNTSRLIVDNIASGGDYSTIKKVFHISLLYFSWGNMQKPLYHGKTIIHEVDTKNPVDLHIKEPSGKIIEITHALPEYFLISIPLFDDVVRQDIDEWLYVMKNEDTQEGFKSPHIKKLADRINFVKLSPEEKDAYLRYVKETISQKNVILSAKELGIVEGLGKGLQEGLEKGKAEGKAEGRLEERKAMIKQLHASGMDIEAIQKATQIPQEELKGILEQ